jgi:hypothetical protein
VCNPSGLFRLCIGQVGFLICIGRRRGLNSARKMSGRFRFDGAWLDLNNTNPHSCISSWMHCVVTWCDALTDTSKMFHKFFFFFFFSAVIVLPNERTETLTVFCYILPRKCLFSVCVCVCVCVQYDIIIIICQRTHINITAILFYSRGGWCMNFISVVATSHANVLFWKTGREGHG